MVAPGPRWQTVSRFVGFRPGTPGAMDINLPNVSSINVPSVDVGDISDALHLDRLGSAVESFLPDLDDVTSTATSVARQGGRIGTRVVRSTTTVIRRNPREAIGTAAIIVAVVALVMYLKKRSDSSSDLKLAQAA